MRPRQLEIQGLQSFKEVQKIDFDLLGETGLFGIFGPTGSGKSTVLDAITLALYGSVQRASRGTQGIINTDIDSVRVSFSFDLLKENERRTYRVERLFKRKKGLENSAETKLVRLFEISSAGEAILSDKLGEVNAKVVELIGLQEDDFTRSVVLPQNKFQEFLLMEKAKKREMLERIFYLEEYGRRLMDKVAKKLMVIRTGLASLQGAMSTLGDASEEALAKVEEELKAAEERRQSLGKELKKAEAVYAEAKEIRELCGELQTVADREKEHLRHMEDISRKKVSLNNSLRAQAVVDFIRSYRETVQKLVETQGSLGQINAEFPLAEDRMKEGIRQHEEKVLEGEAAKPLLIEQKTRLIHAFEIKKEVDGLIRSMDLLRVNFKSLREKALEKEKEIAEKSSHLEDTEQKISRLKKDMELLKVDIDYRNAIQEGVRLEDELSGAFKGLEERKARQDELQSRTNGFEAQLSILQTKVRRREQLLQESRLTVEQHQQARPCDREELLKGMRELQGMNTLVEMFMAAHQDLLACTQRLADAGQAREQLTKNALLFDEERKRRTLYLGELVQEREEAKGAMERNTAARLAKTLKDGQACPVCGSSHHPSPAEGMTEDLKILEKNIDDLERLVLQADREVRRAEGEHIKLEEQLKAIETQQAQYLEEYNHKIGRKGELSARLPMEIQIIEPEKISGWLELKLQNMKDRLTALEQWEALLEELQKNVANHKDALVLEGSEEKTKKAELILMQNSLEDESKSSQEAAEAYEEKQKFLCTFIEKYGIESPLAEWKRLEEDERKSDMLLREGNALQELEKNIRKELEKLTQERQELGEKLKEIEVDGRNLKQRKEEKDEKLVEFAGISDFEEEIKAVDTRLLELSQQERQLLESAKSMKENYDRIIIRKNSLENQQDIYSKSLEEEEKRLQAALMENGFQSMELAEAALLPAEGRKVLDNEISEYERNQGNMRAQRELLEKRLNGRSITEDVWHGAFEDFQNKMREKEEGISLLEGLKNRYATLKENLDKWSGLNNEYQTLNKKTDMLEQIQKLLKGNTFIDFISEERLRYVAREASEILGVLTKFRYNIELDPENGFVVRDNASGGVCRLVSSLSGGETFLTSLALALALSKQIQLKGQSPLEFFFLDEGFGTLDGTLLDTVIDSLERLSSKDRVIGLISHVPELRNRIPRRLVVEPPTMDGRGSRVRIEKL